MIGIVRLIVACVDGFSKLTGGITLLFNNCKQLSTLDSQHKFSDYVSDQNKAEAIKSMYLGIYILMAYGISSALLVSGVIKVRSDIGQAFFFDFVELWKLTGIKELYF